MKKLLALVAVAGAVFVFISKRKKAADAEAKLWDEATGQTS